MKRLFLILVSFAFLLMQAYAQGPSRIAVMANTNGTLLTPTNFFVSNVIAGVGITVEQGAGGKITITGTGTNAPVTNYNGLYITNIIEGTNYVYATTTNVPQGLLSWEWLTNILAQTGFPITNSSLLVIVTNIATNLVVAGSATNAQPPHAILTNLSNTGAITNLMYSNIFYLSPYGNDATALVGRPDKPWGTLSNACRALVNGSALIALDGQYTNLCATIGSYGGECAYLYRMYKLTNVVFRSEGYARFYHTNQMSGLVLDDCDGIIIDGVVFEGQRHDDNPFPLSRTWGEIEICRSTNVIIQNIKILGGVDFGILHPVDPSCGGNVYDTIGVVVKDSYFSWLGSFVTNQNRYDGNAIAGGSWTIEGCTAVDCASGFEPYPWLSGGSMSPTRIVGNKVFGVLVTGIGSSSWASRESIVSDNWIINPPGYTRGGSNPPPSTGGIQLSGIWLDNASATTLRNNVISGMSNAFYFGATCTNTIMFGNTVTNCTTYVEGTTGSIAQENFIPRKLSGSARIDDSAGISWNPSAAAMNYGPDPIFSGIGVWNFDPSGTNRGALMLGVPFSAGVMLVQDDYNSGSTDYESISVYDGYGINKKNLRAATVYADSITLNGSNRNSWPGGGTGTASIPGESNVFYVSTLGSDTNSGTLTSPFLTLTNAVLNCSPNSNSVIFIQPGRYAVGGVSNGGLRMGSIILSYRTNITFWPLGTAELWGSNAQTFIFLQNSYNIRFKPGMRFVNDKNAETTNSAVAQVGPAPDTMWGAIHLLQSEFVDIDGAEFDNLLAYGIYGNSPLWFGGDVDSTNVTVRNCSFTRCGIFAGTALSTNNYSGRADLAFCGGGVAGGGGWTIDNCYFRENNIDIWPRQLTYTTAMPKMVITRNKSLNANYRSIDTDWPTPAQYVIRGNHFERSTNGLANSPTNTLLHLPYMLPYGYPVAVVLAGNDNVIQDNTFVGWYDSITFDLNKRGANTNLTIVGNVFQDGWKYTLAFAPENSISWGTRIINNVFNRSGDEAIIGSASLIAYCHVENNNINLWDRKNAGQPGITFKLAGCVSNVVVSGNHLSGSPAMGAPGIYVGRTNAQYNVQIGDNPTTYAIEAWDVQSVTNSMPLRRDAAFIVETNGTKSVGIVFPDIYTNAVLRTNYLGETNWIASLITSLSGGATNAVGAVRINGTNVVASGATNITFWEGSNVTLTGTNSPAGAAHILIAATGGTGSGETNTMTNLVGGVGIYRSKDGVEFKLKSIAGTNGVVITTNDNFVTVDTEGVRPVAKVNGTPFGYASSFNFVPSGNVQLVGSYLGSDFSLNIGDVTDPIALAYTIGSNGTNFTYGIGANNTNFAYSIGANGTNFAYSMGANGTNFAYSIGANGTNFSYSIGENATNYANSLLSIVGAHFYLIGSASSNVVSLQPTGALYFASPVASSGEAVTNNITLTNNTPGQYYWSAITTNSYYSLPGGAVTMSFVSYENTAGSATHHFEVYTYDGTNLTDLATSADQTIFAGTTPTLQLFTASYAATNATVPLRLVFRMKAAATLAPTISVVTEGAYDSHVGIALPSPGYVLTSQLLSATNDAYSYARTITNDVLAKASQTGVVTNAPVYTNGELMVSSKAGGAATAFWTSLQRGTDGQVLKVSGTNVAWGTDNTGGGSDWFGIDQASMSTNDSVLRFKPGGTVTNLNVRSTNTLPALVVWGKPGQGSNTFEIRSTNGTLLAWLDTNDIFYVTHLYTTNQTNASLTVNELIATTFTNVGRMNATNIFVGGGGGWTNITDLMTNYATLFTSTNAATGVRGMLTGTDWDTFNGKQAGNTNLSAISGLSLATGDILVFTNGALQKLPRGAAGKVLKIDPGGSWPIWGDDSTGSGGVAVLSGFGIETNLSGSAVTVGLSNAVTTIASNAATAQVDFTTTPDYKSTDVMRANLALQVTNLVAGRSVSVFLTGDTNANNRTVTVSTNGIAGGVKIRWHFNCATNGSSDFTVTNNMRAEISLKCLSATEIWATYGHVR